MHEALVTSLTEVIKYFGPYPILLFLMIMGLAPWGILVWTLMKMSKALGKISSEQSDRMTQVFDRQDKRFEQVVKMYEDNVGLVKSHQSLVENQQDTNDKLIDLVTVATSTQQTLVDYIKNNWWCPMSKDPTLMSLFKEKKQ